MKIFVSCLTYELGKQFGIRDAARVFAEQLVRQELDPRHLLPAARTIRRMRDMGDLIVYHGAGTALPKARSRAAHAALASGADLWVMVDDDVETDRPTLQRLITLAADRCAVLPCALRGVESERHIVNIVWDGLLVGPDGARPVRRGGCGLMVVSRAGLQKVTDYARDALSFVDDDGQRKVALFHQTLHDERWLNEDYSFCERLRDAGVSIVAPVVGRSSHDNTILELPDCASIDSPPDEHSRGVFQGTIGQNKAH